MYLGKPHTSSNIAWHRPQSTASREEDELMEKSSRALSHTTDPLEKLRLLCLSRGACGIMKLGRAIRHLYNNRSKQLNKDEFLNGIRETGLDLSQKDAEDLFDQLDMEKTGTISLDEFLIKIRPPMSESRREIVHQAFKKLDKLEDGAVTVDEIKAVYSVTCNPRYMSGEETGGWVMGTFLANFETEGVVDGKVTIEDFMDYYSGIGVAIDNDCYFDLMIRQMFKL